MRVKREALRAAIATLAKLYPNTFVAEKWEPHRPLKVGIYNDLTAANILRRRELHAALAAYTAHRTYLLAMTAGAPRIGLDGLPAGTVTEQDAESAAERLHALDARHLEATRTARRQPSPAPTTKSLSLADLKVAAQSRQQREMR
jgi:ProP effector